MNGTSVIGSTRRGHQNGSVARVRRASHRSMPRTACDHRNVVTLVHMMPVIMSVAIALSVVSVPGTYAYGADTTVPHAAIADVAPARNREANDMGARDAYAGDGRISAPSIGTAAWSRSVGSGRLAIRQADDGGSGSYMTNIDLTNVAQKDNDKHDSSGGGSTLVQNGIKAMQQLVNRWLLPIGLIVVVARLMYIAIFPLMIGIDPFDVIDTDSFREGPQSVMRRTTRGGNGDGSKDPSFGLREYDWGAKGDWRVKLTQEQIEYIMKQELIGSGKVLLMIIIVWGVINLAIWFAGTILGYVHI